MSENRLVVGWRRNTNGVQSVGQSINSVSDKVTGGRMAWDREAGLVACVRIWTCMDAVQLIQVPGLEMKPRVNYGGQLRRGCVGPNVTTVRVGSKAVFVTVTLQLPYRQHYVFNVSYRGVYPPCLPLYIPRL